MILRNINRPYSMTIKAVETMHWTDTPQGKECIQEKERRVTSECL